MVKSCLFKVVLVLTLIPAFGFAADFEVGKSKVTIEKIRGGAVYQENGQEKSGSDILNADLKPAGALKVSPSSEVWLKVLNQENGGTSYLRLSTTSCGILCSYNPIAGKIVSKTINSGGDCEKSIDFHDRARKLAGLPDQNLESKDTSTLVSFASTTDSTGGITPPVGELPPAGYAPGTPGGGGEGYPYLPPAGGTPTLCFAADCTPSDGNHGVVFLIDDSSTVHVVAYDGGATSLGNDKSVGGGRRIQGSKVAVTQGSGKAAGESKDSKADIDTSGFDKITGNTSAIVGAMSTPGTANTPLSGTNASSGGGSHNGGGGGNAP